MLLLANRALVARYKVLPNYSISWFHNMDRGYRANDVPKSNRARGKVSRKAQSRIMNAVQWMKFFSDKKRVYSKATKKTFNFRLNFITLTLSAKQQHTDTFILHHMMYPLMKYLERKYNVVNYVWKAEVQANRLLKKGERCIHFHITTHKFIHYKKLRAKWNALQLKYGYRKATEDPNSTDVHSVR